MTAEPLTSKSCSGHMLRPVRLHGVLAAQGGAARVMRLLAAGMEEHGFTAQVSSEFRDSADPAVREIAPRDLAVSVPLGRLCHAHGSRCWPDLLRGFSHAKRRVDMITLHDCSLLTGGCIHPQDCPGWLEGCPVNCPQGCPEALQQQRALREALLAQGPRLISPSVWLRKMVRAALPELKCELIPNGVEDPLLSTSRERARASFGLNAGAKLLLFAAHGGTLAANKGGRDFLAVWDKVKADMPDAVAFIVGGAKLSRAGDVYYWPYVDTLKMHAFMLAADVFVSASPAENHSLLILEAMAAGVPVCAYHTGGVPEQVTNEQTGLLAPVGKVGVLSGAVQALLADPARSRSMGVKARARYERTFRAERMVQDYTRLYAALAP